MGLGSRNPRSRGCGKAEEGGVAAPGKEGREMEPAAAREAARALSFRKKIKNGRGGRDRQGIEPWMRCAVSAFEARVRGTKGTG